MTTGQAVRLLSALIAASVIAGCSSGGTSAASHSVAAAASSQSGSPAASAGGSSAAPVVGQAAPVSNALTCGTVVDPTGYENGPLTTNTAVAFLTDMLLTDGVANIPAGTPSSDDTNILGTMATELANYSGNKLSADAEQDISALEKDCPQGFALGVQWRNGGGS